MKYQKHFLLLLCALLSQAAAVTLTLDQNYSGAPAPATFATDAHGSLTGAPLPVPERPAQTFKGWFTQATGGSRVVAGASGTAFTADATIYAQWADRAPVDMSAMPPAMKENFDWLKNDRYPRESYMPISVPNWGWYNTIFDQIWDGNGSLNYAVRWETSAKITLAQRRQVASMLHEAVNVWTRPLIGMEGWPFQEISVKIAGWAVSDGARIEDKQPNEVVWVNNAYDDPGPASASHPTDRIASATKSLTRVNNLSAIKNNRNYQYGGDPHARVDLYLWCTEYDFGAAGHGSWWGQRLPSTAIISAANSGGAGSGVLLHEIGHGFGLYDFYGAVDVDKPPTTSDGKVFGQGDLKGLMWNGTSAKTLNEYDTWQIRYWWDWIRTATPPSANRFPMPTTSVAMSDNARSRVGADPRVRPSLSITGRTLSISSPNNSVGTMSIRMIDTRGKVVARYNARATGDGRPYTFPLTNIPAGKYFVDVKGAGVRQTLSVVIK